MSLKSETLPSAESDLARQMRWYRLHAGDGVAVAYWEAFLRTVQRLGLNPESGRIRRFRVHGATGVRSALFPRPFDVHQVFYRVEGDTLQILRVLHGARDLPRRLREASPIYAAAG